MVDEQLTMFLMKKPVTRDFAVPTKPEGQILRSFPEGSGPT
jgi:hypothetical protein